MRLRCVQVRLHVLADPRILPAALAEHASQCDTCRDLVRGVREFEALIGQALDGLALPARRATRSEPGTRAPGDDVGAASLAGGDDRRGYTRIE